MFISIASVAALVCAAVTVYLVWQINRTRLTLQEDGVVEFNFVQQNDHNFDEFAHALRAWQVGDGAGRADAERAYLSRFDIIWSAFSVSGAHWAGSLRNESATDALLADGRAFLARAEPLMSAGARPSDAEVERLVGEARALGQRIYELGLEMYQQKSLLRDEIARRMDRLTRAVWFFGATLAIAGLTLFALLWRAYGRASSLVERSEATQGELARALEASSRGDIERRRQNRFIATASHDLRQPLHALGLYLTTLRGHVSTPLGRRILENASRSTESLNQLLSSVLDISRLDAEVIEVREGDHALDDIFELLHRTYLPEANEHGLAYEVQLSGLVVRTDRVLLERILGNLVSNAIRYTEHGRIALCAQRLGERIEISVEDTGPGIPEREREAVFDEYYQIDLPSAERGHGLGLGLSIVHRLARLLELELSVSSSAEGTSFELLVPAGDALAVEALPNERLPARFDGVHFDGLTVLVIDDDRDVRDGMHLLLEQRSCRVMAAESASEARAAIVAEEAIPDVVVADYRLRDGQTGDDAIAEVREEVNEDVPALIVTGDTSPARLREASASGFRLLNKPVVPEELFDAIGELAGRRP